MASNARRGGGDRVLESRHLVGLFLGVVLLCGVFFTLGYVMGRTQYGGAVHAADVLNGSAPSVPASSKSKPAPAAKNAPAPAPDNGGWDFYDNKKSASDHLEPVPAPAARDTCHQSSGHRSCGSYQINEYTASCSHQNRRCTHAQAARALSAARADQELHRPASRRHKTAARRPRNGRRHPTEKISVLRRYLACR